MMGKQEQTRILCLIYSIYSQIYLFIHFETTTFFNLFAFCNTDSHTMFEALGLQGKLQGKPRFPNWRTREMEDVQSFTQYVNLGS